jgi:hypothetical protein
MGHGAQISRLKRFRIFSYFIKLLFLELIDEVFKLFVLNYKTGEKYSLLNEVKTPPCEKYKQNRLKDGEDNHSYLITILTRHPPRRHERDTH